jgi:hypothetical protein
VACGPQVELCLVDLAVYGQGWAVDGRLSAFAMYIAMFVDEANVDDMDLREVSAEQADPEGLRV